MCPSTTRSDSFAAGRRSVPAQWHSEPAAALIMEQIPGCALRVALEADQALDTNHLVRECPNLLVTPHVALAQRAASQIPQNGLVMPYGRPAATRRGPAICRRPGRVSSQGRIVQARCASPHEEAQMQTVILFRSNSGTRASSNPCNRIEVTVFAAHRRLSADRYGRHPPGGTDGDSRPL
jgi:hypothetical protein